MICVQTANNSGIRNCDQEIELVEPLRTVDENGEDVEYINSQANNPAQPEDNTWYKPGLNVSIIHMTQSSTER